MRISKRPLKLLVTLLLTLSATILSGAPAHAEENGVIEQNSAWGSIGRLLIDNGRSGYCTVSLIRSQQVLTAGHCVSGRKLASLTVQLGGVTTAKFSVTRHVTAAHLKNIAVDALAVLTLDQPVFIIPPTRLAHSDEGYLWSAGTRPKSYGWGSLSAKVGSSKELRYSQLKVLDTTVSASVYHGMLKAGETGNGNPRHGDSGGPLVALDQSGNAVIVGVYSSSLPAGAHYYMKTGTNAAWLNSL